MSDKRILEYVWLDAKNNFCSKVKVVQDITKYDYFQEWNYDGSSTGQATTDSSEVILKPRAFFRNPLLFTVSENPSTGLIICDTYEKVLI